jgi:glycosyltransferase involved in cell wall biosynthesis
MKIIQLHDETWDSGLAHYALTLAAALSARGHEVEFWAKAGSRAAREARALGLATLEIEHPWTSLPALRQRLKGAAVINAHTGSSHSLAAALTAGTETRLVRTRGDARPPSRHILARALARRTGLFIAPNRALRDALSEAFPSSRVELVYQGIAPLGQASPPPQPPVIGILGRLDEVKGHATVLEAAAELGRDFPRSRFLAAGEDTSGRLSALRERARALGLDGRFEFLGKVPEAAAFINRCALGVVASTGSEAVSRAALEWMQLGRPLVATKVGCLPELIEEGRTGLLVQAGDARALASALSRLLAAPAEAAEMGRRAARRFEAAYRLERFAEETERAYRSVLP